MINPKNATHRARLAPSVDFWSREMEIYSEARRQLILNYVGSCELASKMSDGKSHPMLGNLIQLSAIAHVVATAYGNPRYKVTAQIPESLYMAPRLQEFLNRYTGYLDLGNSAKLMALDSFFGFGISRVNNGLLPGRLRHITGQNTGPLVTRVSQYNFLFDGSADNVKNVGYMGDILYVPLDDIRDMKDTLGLNPRIVDKLEEFRGGRSDNDYRIHSSPRQDSSPQAMTRLAYMYFPDSCVEALWPANDESFGEMNDEPLFDREWDGHADGPYDILSLLDTPDEIIPVSRAASTLRLHTLFNELAHITSEQAKAAKVNQVFETGSDRDAKALDDAEDRKWVGVSNLAKISTHAVPGPDQGQTTYMSIILKMFKEFSGNLDDTLGLGPTAATATQSSLIRQRTTSISQETVRRMNQFMENIGRKLGHLALNHPTLRLPARGNVPGTDIQVDMSFLPQEELPRTGRVDDFSVCIEPYSMPYRSPDERLALLSAAIQRIAQVVQIAATGQPMDIEYYINTEADYNGLPELKELYSDLLPQYNVAKEKAGLTVRPPGTGEYSRTNVSQQPNDSQMFEGMNAIPQAQGPSTADNAGY